MKEYSEEYTEEGTEEHSEAMLEVLFWKPYSLSTHIISHCTRTPLGHCSVGACGVVYDGGLRRPTGWWPREAMPEPWDIITIPTPVSVTLLDRVLPQGQPYPLLSMLSSWAVGYPKYPLSCVGATKRALLLAGIHVTGRTPYGIWEQLQPLLHLHRPYGLAGQLHLHGA